MAVNALSLLESLRPWRNAGVFHFLSDVLGDDDAAALHASAFSLQSDAVSDQGERPPRIDSREWSIPVVQDAGAGSPPRTMGAEPSSHGERRADPARPSAQTRGVAPEAPHITAAQAKSEPWPSEWQALFVRTRPAPLLWTYAELGADLTFPDHPGRAERSALLKECIGRLHLPKGTSMFWPLTLPRASLAAETNDNETADAALSESFFFAGLERFRPTVTVLVGPETAVSTGAGLSIDSPFMQEVAGGILYVLLPDFASLATDEEALDKACVFLRTALAGIAALSAPS